MKKALILFSGGKDSMLSTILLIEQGFQVYLVHYDNSFELGSKNVKKGYQMFFLYRNTIIYIY